MIRTIARQLGGAALAGRAAAAAAPRPTATVRYFAGRGYERTPGSVAPPGAADNASAAASASASSTSTSSANGAATMEGMLSNPRLQAALSNPDARRMLQSLLSDPAQLAAGLSNPAVRAAIAAQGEEGRAMLKAMEDPAGREQFFKTLGPAANKVMQEIERRDAKGTTPATPATPVTPTTPATPAKRMTIAERAAPKVETPVAPAAKAAKPAAAPKASQPRTPSPATPSSSSSPSSIASPSFNSAAMDSMLSDPRFASMMSNPQFRAALSDPVARASVNKLLADPAQLQSLLSNPLMRTMANKLAPGLTDMLASPEKIAEMQARMKPELVDSVIKGIEQKIKAEEKATAVAAATAATTSSTAAAAPSAAKVAAAAAPTAAPSAAVSGSGSDSTPPPPPPSSTSSTAAPEDVLSPNVRRAFSFTDLMLGILVGVLLYQVGVFVLDHPEALDAVVAAAEGDELIQAKCGSPLKAGWTWSGSVNPTHASLVVPVSGPKGEAIVHARAFYDAHAKQWKMMLLQASVDGDAQKHTLLIPDKFVIKPRYVSPEEAERIRLKYQNMQQKMAEKHGKPIPPNMPSFTPSTPAPTEAKK